MARFRPARPARRRLAVSVRHLVASARFASSAIALEEKEARSLRQIAQADLAEVQAGQAAAGKASNAEVKKFAQHMVDDHGKHIEEVRSLAKSKGVQVPSAPDRKHQDAMKKLEEAKDGELKAAAQKAAPVIEKHLEEAKTIASSLKR